MKRLILLELNEINFDVVKTYLDNGHELNGFKRIIEQGINNTESESEYKNLEPWIQWPSVHTGKSFIEHNVFRLGDFINSNDSQFFEKVEDAGFKVGAISPMNASNKLKSPAYFIPDPWIDTNCDDSFFSKIITDAIRQSVNDNSQSKLTFKTICGLGITFLAFVRPTHYFSMAKYAFEAIRKPWKKALFLDKLLFEIHQTLYRKKNPNFSTLFLNAGAHIQHHYFFNSPFVTSTDLKNPDWYIDRGEDPLLEMLNVYNLIILELIDLPNTEVIIATGLSQKPYEKIKFYYRLKDHAAFLKMIGVNFKDVSPRMTRDFLVSFDTVEEALIAEKLLSQILVNNEFNLFGEIDNRGKDIFLVLTYPYEITNETVISYRKNKLLLIELVSFVAIKNGEHQSKGYAYFSRGISSLAPPQNSHVSKIHDTVLKFFNIGY